MYTLPFPKNDSDYIISDRYMEISSSTLNIYHTVIADNKYNGHQDIYKYLVECNLELNKFYMFKLDFFVAKYNHNAPSNTYFAYVPTTDIYVGIKERNIIDSLTLNCFPRKYIMNKNYNSANTKDEYFGIVYKTKYGNEEVFVIAPLVDNYVIYNYSNKIFKPLYNFLLNFLGNDNIKIVDFKWDLFNKDEPITPFEWVDVTSSYNKKPINILLKKELYEVWDRTVIFPNKYYIVKSPNSRFVSICSRPSLKEKVWYSDKKYMTVGVEDNIFKDMDLKEKYINNSIQQNSKGFYFYKLDNEAIKNNGNKQIVVKKVYINNNSLTEE